MINKPMIRHCKNCKYGKEKIIRFFLDPDEYYTECQVIYKRINHERLKALCCKYYTPKENKND